MRNKTATRKRIRARKEEQMNSRNEEITLLADDILNDFELSKPSFESILLKIKKLARLREDYETINWVNVELNGYSETRTIQNFPHKDKFKYAKLSGRNNYTIDENKQEIEKFWIRSIPELESKIISSKISLESIQAPSSFTPAIITSKTQLMGEQSYVKEKMQDVLNKIEAQRITHANNIMESQALLSKIKNNFYNYVLNIYLSSKFENVTETLFQKTKRIVDEKLTMLCPDAIKKLVAAYNRFDSTNEEELSQAMSSCRNVLKEFADAVYPPSKDKYIRRDGSEISVTDDKYKNRLIAFIEENEKRTNKVYLQARTSDLVARIHSLNDLLSKGTHIGIDKEYVNICIIDTYLVLGSMLNYEISPTVASI